MSTDMQRELAENVEDVEALETDAETDAETDVEAAEAEARRVIIRALNRNPYDVWTRESLARSLGISSGLAGTILTKLASAGMVHRLRADDGFDEEYTVAGDDDVT